MHRRIKVLERTESVTVIATDTQGTYKVVWHRTDGLPPEEFHVAAESEEAIDVAVAEDLKRRMGP